MKEIIANMRKEAGNDKVKLQIVRIIEGMLEAAPEIEIQLIDKKNGIQAVYNKLREMRSGDDTEILKVIEQVYELTVGFDFELRIVKKGTAEKSEQKIVDLFDFMS